MPRLRGYTGGQRTRMCCFGSSNQGKHSAGWAGRPRSFPKSRQTVDKQHSGPVPNQWKPTLTCTSMVGLPGFEPGTS